MALLLWSDERNYPQNGRPDFWNRRIYIICWDWSDEMLHMHLWAGLVHQWFLHFHFQRYLHLVPLWKKISMYSKVCNNWSFKIYTAWPRGGHLLGLIDYMIARVHQIFCYLNHLNLAIFEICINPNGCPPLTFINPKVLKGVPSSNFHQPKGFERGALL